MVELSPLGGTFDSQTTLDIPSEDVDTVTQKKCAQAMRHFLFQSLPSTFSTSLSKGAVT